jgi:ornithine--oxo-acid transaminase
MPKRPERPSITELMRTQGPRRFELHDKYVNPPFRRMLKVVGMDAHYVRAAGGELWDSDGRKYLDFLTHSSVFSIGHNHPHVAAALREVADAQMPNMLLMDCSPLSGVLAERLLGYAPHLGKVYFGNSGAEAVEAALKMSRCATGRPRILHFQGAYHGLTYGAVSVVGHPMWREGFAPFLPECVQIPFGDLDALKAELDKGGVACLLGETVQGDGGVNIPPAGFWPAAADLCRRAGALLVLDEIQVGMGRTGRFFAYEHFGVEPDIVLIAKPLSGGHVPVSAALMRDWIFDKVFSGLDRCVVHCGTYCENNLAMAAGLATLDVMEDEDLSARAADAGAYLLERLRPLASRYPLVRDVRGLGLIVGIEFRRPAEGGLGLRLGWDLMNAANEGLFAQMVVMPLFREHGILCQLAGHEFHTLKLMPILAVSRADIDQAAAGLDAVLARIHSGPGEMASFMAGLVGRMMG